MKLNDEQIQHVAAQTGLDPIPDEDLTGKLAAHFGDHTFYLGPDGLYVWEALKDATEPTQPAAAVLLAIWADEAKSTLTPAPPTTTQVTVHLAPAN